jgi:hypothetical protein
LEYKRGKDAVNKTHFQNEKTLDLDPERSRVSSYETSEKNEDGHSQEHYGIINVMVDPPSRKVTRTDESILHEELIRSNPSSDRITIASTLKIDRGDSQSPLNSIATNYSPTSGTRSPVSMFSPFSVYNKHQKVGNSIGLDQLSSSEDGKSLASDGKSLASTLIMRPASRTSSK